MGSDELIIHSERCQRCIDAEESMSSDEYEKFVFECWQDSEADKADYIFEISRNK